jgi:F-type H+-transporting ATPase subunit gamma
MAGLKQIKSKIRSIDKTRTVTKAMEAVSAAKMRKAQQRALAGRAYARAAASVLARVSGSQALNTHSLVVARPINRVLYIVITADRGLAGALNSAVLRATYADVQSFDSKDALIIAVGRKANEFFQKRGFEMLAYHENADDRIDPALMQEILNEAARAFTAGEVDLVKIAYQNFITTFEQRPIVRQIFPLSLDELNKVVESIVPKHGQFSDLSASAELQASSYTIEPSEEEILNTILPKLAGIFVYHALLESKASEHSARMVAMKSASDKGAEISHLLTLKYNKARQAAITREVSEITGGMEAMSSS